MVLSKIRLCSPRQESFTGIEPFCLVLASSGGIEESINQYRACKWAQNVAIVSIFFINVTVGAPHCSLSLFFLSFMDGRSSAGGARQCPV